MPHVAIFTYWLFTCLLFGAYLAVDGVLTAIDWIIFAGFTALSLGTAVMLAIIIDLLQTRGP